MNDNDGLAVLAALAHPTRLEAFRLLVRHEPDGLSTGELVEATGLTQSTFSTHLAVLAKAGLVDAEKRGRQMIQRARMDRLRDLMLFLAKDCCQGRAELCAPLLAELSYRRPEPLMPTDVVIYHNPACGTSRNTLAMIRNAGVEPHVIEYLKKSPSRATLVELIERAGLTPRQLLREKGTPYATLGLDGERLSDDALVEAMMDHPKKAARGPS